MGNLILNLLELRKYRSFQHLKIERLGRVNLIVGKNNVGKSNLLDALQMYAHRASTSTIFSEIMETSPPFKEITCVLVPANGLNKEQIIELWDGIASTGLEREVSNALRLITPGAAGLNLVSTPASKGQYELIANVAGIDEPLSLYSLGNGMRRNLGIALALLNLKTGYFSLTSLKTASTTQYSQTFGVSFFAWRIVSTSRYLQRHIAGIASRHSRGLLAKIIRRKNCLTVWKAKRVR